jgi:hypothetical protein
MRGCIERELGVVCGVLSALEREARMKGGKSAAGWRGQKMRGGGAATTTTTTGRGTSGRQKTKEAAANARDERKGRWL